MRRILFTYIALIVSLVAWSQASTIATGFYECSFEENEDLSAWTLNPLTVNNPPAADAHDQWMIGTAAHSDRKRSLYVSANGENPSYSDHRNVVAAYLTYQFPSAGKYDISFDWRGMGSIASSLHVMLCPLAYLTDPRQPQELAHFLSSDGQMPNNVPLETIYPSGGKSLYGSETWQNVYITASLGARQAAVPFALVFIWENQLNANKDSIQLSGFAIDNLQINDGSLKKPTELDVDAQCLDSTLLVSWVCSGAANEFDVQYRAVGAETWRNAGSGLSDGTTGFTLWTEDGVQHYSFIIPRILEGSYDVRVRASDHGEMQTGWVYSFLNLVYCPDNHCVNYLDLYSSSVTCTYGHNPVYEAGVTPYDSIGVVDYGPDNELSRHTIHVDPTEVDPRTDDGLKTVPDGALASVRLGNWKTRGEAESITYDILVDSAHQGILIVKYAVVLENPGGYHKLEEEPRFELVVLDSLDNPIDMTCGRADFYYSDGANSDWNKTKDDKVAWKDWTTVGLNLMPYNGQHIRVRFTTYDCGQGGHFSYAYFMVDCANAHLETENCGPDAKITCKAPEGFIYEWTDETGKVVSDSIVLDVDAGMHTYTCKISFKENPDCFFEVSTVSAPRFPVPEYTYENVFGECQSKLKFHNTSHVMNKFDGYENHTSEECEDWHWEITRLSDGTVRTFDTKEPSYLCPPEGDTIAIKYTCYIGAENACDSTRYDTIVVPNIYTEPRSSHQEACKSYKIGNELITKDTTITVTYSNFAECDSVVTLYLKIWPAPEDTYRNDSICSDGYISIGGIKYTEPVKNKEIFLQGQHGCDSVVYLTLTVNERLQASVEPLAYACPDEEQMQLYFDITAGVYDSLRISFSTPELHDTVIYENVTSVAIPYAANITPGYYKAVFTFYQFCCGEYVEERPIDIRYASTIVEQKWNDVLTVLSPKYNGGFEFVSFQWYKNGQPMEGETHSYIYQPLDFTAEYYVVATRSDSVSIASCPIVPVHHEEQTPYPTIVQAGQRIPMYMERSATIWYYTVSGQLYSTFEMPQGYASLMTPNDRGAYIIKSIDAEGQTKAQVILVE